MRKHIIRHFVTAIIAILISNVNVLKHPQLRMHDLTLDADQQAEQQEESDVNHRPIGQRIDPIDQRMDDGSEPNQDSKRRLQAEQLQDKMRKLESQRQLQAERWQKSITRLVDERQLETEKMIDKATRLLNNATEQQLQIQEELLNATIDRLIDIGIVSHYGDVSSEVKSFERRFLSRIAALQETLQKTTTMNARDCFEILRAQPDSKSGVYTIVVGADRRLLQVYCDMTTNGGGWTVFQRRQDGSVNFQRTFSECAYGFGSLNGEFWLGNDYVAALTALKRSTLRVDVVYSNKPTELEGKSGYYSHRGPAYSEYSNFTLGGALDKYAILSLGSHTGNTGPHLFDDQPIKFSTYDQNNQPAELYGRPNCSERFTGPWWHPLYCQFPNLNSDYKLSGTRSSINKEFQGMCWTYCWITVSFSEMKIRPV